MKRVYSWVGRQVGDVFFYAGTCELSRLIIDVEKELNPVSKDHYWVPSHAGIIGIGADAVTEAWLDFEESSAAAVHRAGKYDGEFDKGRMQLWRPGGLASYELIALDQVIKLLGPQPYGVLAIVGFEIELLEKFLFGVARDNPIKHARVCSMTALTYIRWTKAEPWADTIAIEDCSPDILLRAIEASESPEVSTT